jgi:hypothetical protein
MLSPSSIHIETKSISGEGKYCQLTQPVLTSEVLQRKQIHLASRSCETALGSSHTGSS